VVKKGWATLSEIDRWSLDDLMRANALMDYEADLELVNQPKPKEGRR